MMGTVRCEMMKQSYDTRTRSIQMATDREDERKERGDLARDT